MGALFVSHSSSDQAATQQVVERLDAEGFAALFLDFDSVHGIPAGGVWESELYAQLRKADGVIFLASAASVASQWCFAEISMARSLDKPVFPLRLEAGVRLGFARRRAVDRPKRRRDSIRQIVGGIATGRVGPGRLLRLGPNPVPVPGTGVLHRR